MVSLSSTFGNLIRTVAAVVSKQKPAVAAFNYNSQSRNCYHNHIRMLFRMVSSASTRVEIMNAVDKVQKESIENTKNNMLIDDFCNSKTEGIEVFSKALEREGVTFMTYCVRSKYAREFTNAIVSRSKLIDMRNLTSEACTYYTAIGFAVADQGHGDRPGVCCIPANSGFIVNDVLVKFGRAPVVFILVPSDKDDDIYSLRFNNDAYMSVPYYYRVSDVRDITTTVHQAFSSAYNEPGGPVFIDIQHLLLDHVDYEEDLRTEAEIVVDFLRESWRWWPAVIYVSSSLDDGVEQEKKELSRFQELTGIQVTHSLVGLDNILLVFYVGATCNDLPEIVVMNENQIVLLIDVGDEEEMQKFIKPRGRLTTFPTFKEINEILVAKEINFDDGFLSGRRSFLEYQRQSEYVLASCYADIIRTNTADNDKRITREFAIHVLDEFFENNKEKVMVYRGDNDWWRIKHGAEIAGGEKDVYVVIDGFEKGILVNDYCRECVIILDDSGWTKRFYQETRKGVIGDDDDDDDDDRFIVGEVVTEKCDLKNALYQYHESHTRKRMWLVIAVVPDRFVEEEIPNFSRDLRFFHYPNAYAWKLVDRSPPTD